MQYTYMINITTESTGLDGQVAYYKKYPNDNREPFGILGTVMCCSSWKVNKPFNKAFGTIQILK